MDPNQQGMMGMSSGQVGAGDLPQMTQDPGMTQNSMQPMDPQAGQQQQGPPPDQQQQQPEEDYGNSNSYFDYALSQSNLAKKLRDKTNDDGDNILEKMGEQLVAGIDDDNTSRQDWLDRNDEWLSLSLLLRESKSFPWPKASNVKYPLVATAAMQFSARAYPTLVPQDGGVVKARVVPADKDGQLSQKASRVARHMSYQVMCQLPNWEEETDKLLMTMAVSGICFRKTFHDSALNKHCSSLVYPENFIVNYYAKSLDSAYRKTEILYYTENEYKEKVLNDEEFLEYELPTPKTLPNEPKRPKATEGTPPRADKSTPHAFYACHTYWDLDKDGYEEPYIVTIHRDTKKVVRIVARWDSDGVIKNASKKIQKIVPVEYFTDFPFIPNPDGSIYACGFGMLLGPLNESVNTLINQLVDAGTLSVMPSGFIGKNLRIKMGQVQLRPGQWMSVNATGEDMNKSFFPLPVKEPSTVLLQLLNMLVTSGNQLASIAEIFVGKMPGQNTTATTTQETIQQGMAVFTAIYKRVYRSLGKEFKKLFRLNRLTPDIIKEEAQITGEQIQTNDYEGTEHLILPGGDPTGDSSTVRIMKLQQVGQLMQFGTINPQVFTQRMLEANEIPNYQELIAQPQPQPPDPAMVKAQADAQNMQQKAQLDAQAKQQELELKKQLAELEAQLKQMEMKYKEQELAMKLQGEQSKQHLDMVAQTNDMQMQQQKGQMETQIAATKAQSDIATNEAMNRQSIQHGQQQHQQKMQQTKQQAALKNKGTKPNGGSK